MLPNGAVEKGFLTEMTRLINAWNDESENLKDIAIKALMFMPALLLQKPSYKSKAKHHSECHSECLVCINGGKETLTA